MASGVGEPPALTAGRADEPAALRREIEILRARLIDSEETLRAIRHGEVDALVVGAVAGEERLFTLSSADRTYRNFVESMSDGAATVSADGIVLYANQALADMLVSSCRQIVGTPFVDLVLESRRERLSEVMASASPAGSVEAVLVGPSGNTVPVLVGVSSLQVGGDAVTCVTITDLTSERQVEADLARYNTVLHAQQRSFSEALQYSLLTDPPQSQALQIAVRYQPATHDVQVGGDWYDALVTPSGETVIVIGDVVGHDTQATVMMGQLRGLLRGIAYTTGEGPGALLARLEALIEGLALDTLATAIVARVEPAGDSYPSPHVLLRWSNAGHPPAMLVRPDGHVQPLVADDVDQLLGVDPTSPHRDHVTALTPGCTVLLYTDGLVERRGSCLDDGIERLTTTLRAVGKWPLERLCDEVLARLAQTESEDDVALLAMRLPDVGSPAARARKLGRRASDRV
jgi:PAS domain S-box-containing protein